MKTMRTTMVIKLRDQTQVQPIDFQDRHSQPTQGTLSIGQPQPQQQEDQPFKDNNHQDRQLILHLDHTGDQTDR